jgi:hypothetical protein
MDDAEFLKRMRERIEQSTGLTVELALGEEGEFSVDVDARTPRVVMGKDALLFSGRARMLMQFAILCLRERRQVSEDEFLRFLQRN